MSPSPEQQKQAPALPAAPLVTGRFPYGWRPVPVFEEDGSKVFGQYRKQFTHEPRTILLGAPKRGGRWVSFAAERARDIDIFPLTRRQETRCNECKPTRYIVWPDRSLRSINKLLRKQFEGMSMADQSALLMMKEAE